MILVSSIVSTLEIIPKSIIQDKPESRLDYSGSLAMGTDPVNYFVLGGQVSAGSFPTMHLSFQDILAVNSAATVRGASAGQPDKGLIVAAIPLQSSILSDSNFYARYTYGNRNRGLKLSHWNAGSAHLENKTIQIENLISDHHPHLLGISEAKLHKDHCIDNCKIDD